MIMLINGSAKKIALPDKSVNCVVTSPPYYGLRDYGTAEWVGGDPECEHTVSDWNDNLKPNVNRPERDGYKRQFCIKCGAIRVDKQIGLEQTPDDYVAAMVQVFREVWRVLRDDGTVWLNLGDSYSSFKDCKSVPDSLRVGGSSEPANIIEKGKSVTRNTRAMKAAGLKNKDLIGIPWRVAFALQTMGSPDIQAMQTIERVRHELLDEYDNQPIPDKVINVLERLDREYADAKGDSFWLRQDIIWCLSGGVKVYAKTQKTEGPMLIKDLVRLDPTSVQLWNGYKWTQVLGWSEAPRPEQPLEIVLRSGERIGCTPNHKWPTQRGLLKASELLAGDVIDSCGLPQPKEPETPQYIPDDIGWFIGMYIAEGSMSGNVIQIACNIKETVRYEIIKSMTEGYGGTANWYSYKGKSASIHIHCPVMKSILNMYVSGRTAKNKRLNPTAWKRSDKFLDSVLLGYLAGDGHQDGERWRLGFTRNYEWEQDLRTICARLGYQLRLKPVNATYQNGTLPAFRGEIRFKKSNHHNAKEDAEIVEIRNSRARKFYDIGVADDPHLFALASGVLTHNSKPNPMPESVKDRCTKAHEYIFLLTKSARYWYDHEAIKEKATGYDGRKDTMYKGGEKDMAGGAHERWQYKNLGDKGQQPHTMHLNRLVGEEYLSPVRNKRSVWTVTTKPYPGSHYAVFPPDLIEPCVLAGCPETACAECGAPYERVVEKDGETHHGGERAIANVNNVSPTSVFRTGIIEQTKTIGFEPTCDCNAGTKPGVVLDPFVGSGTTCMVARKHNRDAIGIDLSYEYLTKNARERLQYGSYVPVADGIKQFTIGF